MEQTDKGLLMLNGKPMFHYPLEALRQVTESIVISANRNFDRYGEAGYPVVSDCLDGFQGPLAGMLSVMKFAKQPYLITLPCDMPLVDASMLNRMLDVFGDHDAEICIAHDGERMHPVVMMLRRDLAGSIEDFLRRGERKLQFWLRGHRTVLADFSDRSSRLANINDLGQLSALSAALGSGEIGDCRSVCNEGTDGQDVGRVLFP